MRLAAEIALARLAGRASRLAGRGGGTTIPGRVLTTLDPTSVRTLASRLPLGSALISATNGKTTTVSMVAEILGEWTTLAHNRAGANLVSGVASALIASPNAELGLFEVDEAALPPLVHALHPTLLCLGNLFRDQLDRYGELELLAERWRRAVAELEPAAWLVVNVDDPLIAALARGRENVLSFGLDDPRVARQHLPHAVDSTHCLICGRPLEYRAAYVGHLGDYRCSAGDLVRPPLDVVADQIELDGLAGTRLRLVTPFGSSAVRLPLPGLYNVYNAVAAAASALALGASVAEIAAGLERFRPAFGRLQRISVGARSLLLLLVKNPAGTNEAIRTLLAGPRPQLAMLALNDEIADGRDISWIWDVDFEPLGEQVEQLVLSGGRAYELALRFRYGGVPRERLEVIPDLEQALDYGLAQLSEGGELPVLPTYTALLALQRIVARRGLVQPYWEAR